MTADVNGNRETGGALKKPRAVVFDVGGGKKTTQEGQNG